jgi:drug/metabolite transporter (DMT)-like permease
MIGAAVFFSLNAAVVKELALTGIDSLQTVFVRSALGLAIPLPFVIAARSALRTKQFSIQLLQGLAGTVALMAHFFAWTKLPLATVTTLIFTQVLFTLVLGVVLLRAWVRWPRWIATAIGFVGVVIMVRPGVADIEPATWLALLAGFCIALQLVSVARLPQGEKTLTMLFYFGLIGTVISAGPGLATWQTPTLMQTELLLGNGLLGVASQACIFRAFRIGDAAFVAPFDYFKLVIATLIGYLLFGEIPTLWTLAGALLIVCSTFYISHLEYDLPQRRPAA